ncbi:MAG: S-methyl-5-thioribose-1-phosphate isomerase [Anaerolineaceae bacterium]|nr:S-methyl-5-thioribose-1-phosphate isomerase [Anaerolineaceae bacterium]
MRTLDWEKSKQQLKMIDQRLLPSTFAIIHLKSYQEVSDAIRNMAVRGAPAIGVAAAYGIVLAALRSQSTILNVVRTEVKKAARVLEAARPTAVNLPWALKRMTKVADRQYDTLQDLKSALLSEAHLMADEDVEVNRSISAHGAGLIDDGDTIIHHCNTGALATVDWGTALGVIRMAFEQGKKLHILVDETRPRLQGARLTAWELSQYKIPYDIISDNSAGYFLRSGKVDKVIFGADRVARNGDVANKIGTYMLALAAHANNVPVYSAFPFSTVDIELESGDLIPIEERPQDEVLDLKLHNRLIAPKDASARNPAFDITPHELITALITEKGVIYPPFENNLINKAHRL